MAETMCPNCHKPVGAAEGVAFCPYCGERLASDGPDLSAVRRESDPVKKHAMLVTLAQEYPDSLEVAEEILYLGRLYERNKKNMDFSIIKCYILDVYLEPDELKPDKREALRREIFHHLDLDRCLELSDDPDAFLRRYLERISEDFIRLFLKGSSRLMRSFFGYTNTSKASKYLAMPAAKMLMAMRQDESLTGEQRVMLMQAFYAAFARQMDGDTQYLDELMKTYSLTIEKP